MGRYRLVAGKVEVRQVHPMILGQAGSKRCWMRMSQAGSIVDLILMYGARIALDEIVETQEAGMAASSCPVLCRTEWLCSSTEQHHSRN